MIQDINDEALSFETKNALLMKLNVYKQNIRGKS
jgi:hypothetical protein